MKDDRSINLNAAIDALWNLNCSDGVGFSSLKYDTINDALNAIKALPPAQPGWIPVTERMPEERDAGVLKKLGTDKRSDYVLATVEVKGERMTVTACTYDGKWHWSMKYAFPEYKVIAWMPLPQPYKEAQNDER